MLKVLLIIMIAFSLSFSKSQKRICEELNEMVLTSSVDYKSDQIKMPEFKSKEKIRWYGLMCTTVGSIGAIYTLGDSIKSDRLSGKNATIICGSALCLVSGLTITIKY